MKKKPKIKATVKPKTNPNGANQYLLDPRQKLCWDFYINPKSSTFGNAYQSAIKAGYTPASAKSITDDNWFVEKARRLNMLAKAEKVLNETLEMDVEENVVSMIGIVKDEKGNPIKKINSNILRIKQDTAKFVASTQGKNDGYSTRVEQTGIDGTPIKTETTITDKQYERAVLEEAERIRSGE